MGSLLPCHWNGTLAESPPLGPLPPLGTLVNMEPAGFPSSMPQTELTKKCCIELPKSPSFDTTTERTACYYICASIRQNCGHCPRICRDFPRSLGCYFHFTLLRPYSSSLKYWLLSRRIVFTFCACVCFVFLNNFWPSHNRKWDNRMNERLKDNVNEQCESSHGATRQFRNYLWVPSLSAFVTWSLSAETESMGFPIHSSGVLAASLIRG